MIRNTIVPFLTLIFCLLFSSYTYCNDGQETLDVIVNFTVPSEWEEVNYYLYTLKDFTKTYNYWREAMSEGHQPWRFDPVNVAAACLWDFGIRGRSKDILFLSDSLVEVNKNQFVLKIKNKTYIVYVNIINAIPIAFKLKVKDEDIKNIKKPPIVDHFACSDYCPGPHERYMVKVYKGVEDEDECRKIGGRPSSYTGWGIFFICIAE